MVGASACEFGPQEDLPLSTPTHRGGSPAWHCLVASGRRVTCPTSSRRPCGGRTRPDALHRRRRPDRDGGRSPRACAAAAIETVSTGSVTISTGKVAVASGPGSRTSPASACAVEAPAVWRTVPGVAVEQRAAGADDHHVRAAPAGLAHAQVEHPAAIGHVAVADDRDHVGAVEIVDARGVGRRAAPTRRRGDRAGRRQRARRRARCGPRRRPPRW